MKHILITTLIIAALLVSCRRSEPSGSEKRSKNEYRAMIDTLSKLDSLVNVNKVRNNQLSRELAGKALNFARKSDSDEALARAYVMMGIAYRIYNNDTSAFYYRQVLNLAGRLKNQSIRNAAMYNYASLFRDATDYKTALLYFDSLIPFARIDNDYRLLSNTFNGIGNIKRETFDTAGARVMFDSALQVADRYSLPAQKGVALASLARLENNPAENISKLKEAVHLLLLNAGFEEEAASVYTNLGVLSQNPDTALCYYDEALRLAEFIHSSELSVAICNNKAYCYLDKKDFKNAEECLVSYAIPLAQQVKNYSWLASLYDTYTDILVAAKRSDDALKYARLAYQTMRLDEATSGAKQVRILTALLDIKNKEIMLANQEKELRRKESHNRMILISFSVSLLILAVLIFLTIWRLQWNRLRYKDSMLKAAKKIIDAEDRERTRMGRDFHDLTGQKFSGLSGYLENQEFTDPETKTVAIKMLEDIRMAVREMSHRMNRAWVERFTLEESLSGLCTDCIRMAGLDLVFTAPEKYPEMSREAKTHLFRIVQELLANAMNHARDAKITIELSFNESSIVLSYNDNGPGFDKTAAIAQGTGMNNIIERVILLGGRISLDTRPGYGTDYEIEIPLKQESIK